MILLERTVAPSPYQWEAVVSAMRNPLMSWDKSDSEYDVANYCDCDYVIGDNDLDLMMRLARAGSSDAKFRRMLPVIVDITAPTFWIRELDTYKVSTVCNSCSIQHKGVSADYVISDISVEKNVLEKNKDVEDALNHVLDTVNILRKLYVTTKDYSYFRMMRSLMPMGLKYKFTWAANYEVLANIYKQRKNHKLEEWHTFCDWIESLPYSEIITLDKE